MNASHRINKYNIFVEIDTFIKSNVVMIQQNPLSREFVGSKVDK